METHVDRHRIAWKAGNGYGFPAYSPRSDTLGSAGLLLDVVEAHCREGKCLPNHLVSARGYAAGRDEQVDVGCPIQGGKQSARIVRATQLHHDVAAGLSHEPGDESAIGVGDLPLGEIASRDYSLCPP